MRDLCTHYERALLNAAAKPAASAASLSERIESLSNDFLSYLFGEKALPPLPSAVVNRQYLLDFRASKLSLRWMCRYLLQRYADLVANVQPEVQIVRNVWRAYQIEHICPTAFKESSDWSVDLKWTKTADELDCLGNLTLIKAAMNASLGDANWALKRPQLAALPVGFQITESRRTIDAARERQRRIVDLLAKDMLRDDQQQQ